MNIQDLSVYCLSADKLSAVPVRPKPMAEGGLGLGKEGQ